MYDLKTNYVNLGQMVTSPRLINSYANLIGDCILDYLLEKEKVKETETD